MADYIRISDGAKAIVTGPFSSKELDFWWQVSCLGETIIVTREDFPELYRPETIEDIKAYIRRIDGAKVKASKPELSNKGVLVWIITSKDKDEWLVDHHGELSILNSEEFNNAYMKPYDYREFIKKEGRPISVAGKKSPAQINREIAASMKIKIDARYEEVVRPIFNREIDKVVFEIDRAAAQGLFSVSINTYEFWDNIKKNVESHNKATTIVNSLNNKCQDADETKIDVYSGTARLVASRMFREYLTANGYVVVNSHGTDETPPRIEVSWK